MAFYSTENIPYIEFGVINELLREHTSEHSNKLRAMILFGSLVASGRPYDINMLEVVEGWKGPRHVIFASTEALPLRGRLELYFLTPEEFEHPTDQPVPGKGWSSADLLARIRNAYTIVTESPAYYASRTMARYDDAASPSDTEVSPGDPISFLKQLENVAT